MIRADIQRTPSRFLLSGVPWSAYLVLRDAPENYHVRMTYDRGELEIMSPSKFHDEIANLIGRLVEAWGEELRIDIGSCRTMTLRREDLARGVEPDNCYYIRHESLMRGKKELDLATDPPPDLAIEVDLGRHAIDNPALYAALGVPELWRHDGRQLRVFRLNPKRRYVESKVSKALAGFPIAEAQRVVGQFGVLSDSALVMSFRESIRGKSLLRAKKTKPLRRVKRDKNSDARSGK